MAPVAADYVEQVAAGIVKQLREGTAPWVKPWQPGERFMPYNPTSGNEYRGMNAVWLMSQAEAKGYGDPRWMTYKQASELGGQVRKGERSTLVVKYGVVEKEGEEGNEVRRPYLRAYHVFNADQVDGKSASDIAAGVSVGGVHVEADGRLTAAINRRGSTPTVSRTGTGQYTVTFPGFTASGDALPQVTIIGDQFGFVRADALNGAVRVFTANVGGQPEDRGFALTVFDTVP